MFESQNVISSDSNVITINNLNPATTYYIYVRSTCDKNVYTDWSAVEIARTS